MSSPERFRVVRAGEVPFRERRGGGASSQDLAGGLGAEHVTLRLWRFGPGHEMPYHRHRTQEEIYGLVSGGPQEVVVDGEVITLEDGDWIRLPKGTPRRIRNATTGTDAVWLTVGAPPGEGLADGVRLDPDTGAEIPR
jgi:quercetin dioxygenase-like cupin family protein